MKQSNKIALFIGILGMVLLQSNSLPFIWDIINGNKTGNIQSSVQAVLGLSCYLFYSIKRRDWLYTVGNLIGITSNLIIIALLLKP